jgi:hypothetical protein
MRTMALALLVLALALPGVQAQPPSFDEAYQVRGALGDIPTTPATEQGGVWNIEQRLTVQFDNASAEADRTYTFTLPSGSTLANATCDCARSTHNLVGTSLSFRIEPQTASGERTIRIVSRQPAGDVFGFSLGSPPAADGSVVILYVPGGSDVSSSLDLPGSLAATTGSATIRYAQVDGALPDGTWFAIHPATTAAEPSDPDAGGNAMDWILPAVLGLVLGMALWGFLVSRGVVQKKSRKQVVATAAHVEAAANDPPAVLEGRKRALLAALKEVELARQANEMPIEVYDVVKADLKKQAVTVMRALETASGEGNS